MENNTKNAEDLMKLSRMKITSGATGKREDYLGKLKLKIRVNLRSTETYYLWAFNYRVG